MKTTLAEKISYRLHKGWYSITHPTFVKKYANRYSSSFTQDDLEYCVAHMYEFRVGKKLDLNNVNTFNEKINWLKCFYHDDRMTKCADKVTAPGYFMEHTGLDDQYIVKNLGVYDSENEINFASLPESFVLKSNWGSGCQIIVKNKETADFNRIKKTIHSWKDIKTNHYYAGFEYGYKNIVPKIVCEEFVKFEYKIEFFCFDGKPVYFWTIFDDKTDDVCADFYDAKTLKKLKMKHGYPNSNTTISIPDDYKQMFDIASKLSKGFPFVRVDFFKTSNGFKFSEMTFYHWNGMKPFDPEFMDSEFGKHLILPEKMI